jgi:hypothetical protein
MYRKFGMIIYTVRVQEFPAMLLQTCSVQPVLACYLLGIVLRAASQTCYRLVIEFCALCARAASTRPAKPPVNVLCTRSVCTSPAARS